VGGKLSCVNSKELTPLLRKPEDQSVWRLRIASRNLLNSNCGCILQGGISLLEVKSL
jgi:hypothetical protein